MTILKPAIAFAYARDVGRGLSDALFSLAFPPTCVFCGVGDEFQQPGVGSPANTCLLCCNCQRTLIEGEPMCRRCAAPTAGATQVDDCPLCRDQHFRFDSATAVGVYRNDLRQAMLRIKNAGESGLALALGSLCGQRASEIHRERRIDLIVPVPMHWRRRLWRGCNPADLLAEAVQRHVPAPVRQALYFRRNTEKQNVLAPSRRWENVKNAFGVSSTYDLEGAQVLLVDDTMTTGATAHEAARTLKNAGAAGVHVAVVSRGVGWR